MSATAIHLWLNGPRSFHEGVALLRNLGEPDEELLFLLSLGETSVSRDALVNELKKLNRRSVRHTSAVRERVLPSYQPPRPQSNGRTTHSDGYEAQALPQQLVALRDELKAHLKEMDYLRHRLEGLPSDNDRLRDALRIVELDDAVVSAYARLDAWRDTGRDPGDTPPPTPLTGVQLQRELHNIISYLSRANSGKRTATPAKLEQWKARKAELEKLIHALPQH